MRVAARKTAVSAPRRRGRVLQQVGLITVTAFVALAAQLWVNQASDLGDAQPVSLSASARGGRVDQANEDAGRPVQLTASSRPQANSVVRADSARLAGAVLDALGGPIAGARVQLWRSGGGLTPLVEARSDDEGRFELWAAPGNASLRAEAAGYAPASRGVVAPSQGVALQMTPAGTISGTVVEQSTGKPLEGAEVRASLDGMRGRSVAAISGYDGQFAIAGLEPGRYVIAAEHERFRAQSPSQVQLGLAQVERDLVVPMVPAVSVQGKIVSEQADACLGGRVTITPADLSQPTAAHPSGTVANVASDGTVQLRGLTPGRYRVDVRCSEQVLAEGPSQLDIQHNEVQATWRVEPGLGLEITVLDASNQAVPRAGLILHKPSAERPGATVLTPLSADENGRARTGNHLRPGSYSLRPSAGLRGEPVIVELRPGAGAVPVTMRVKGSAWIDVDARDEHDQPVDGLQLSARAAESGPVTLVPATALGGGAYRVGPLEAGRYSVHAADGVNHSWGEAAEQRWLSVPHVGSVRTKLSIERSTGVSGSVIDAEGQPAANVWVSVQDASVKSDPLQRRALATLGGRRLTDLNGHFEIDGLSQHGHFDVAVSDPEAGKGSAHDVQPGAHVRLLLTHPTPIASPAGDR